ncbi:MAG: hypothetical protein ACPGF7_07550 [Pontibacterium sp.]
MNELIVGNLLLFICALVLCGRSYRLGGEAYTSGFVISLSGAFIAASAVSSIFLTGTTDQDYQTLLRMLNNLAYYAAIPLIGSAMLADSLGQNWQKPAWGRWLLALLALFEVTRRAESGLGYSQLMAALVMAVMLFSALRYTQLQARLGSIVAGLSLGCAVLLFSPWSLFSAWQNTLAYPAALAVMLLGVLQVLPRNKAPG